MPLFEIKAFEMFETETFYAVEAETSAEAIKKVKSGTVPYESHEHPGNADEFIEVEECYEVKED